MAACPYHIDHENRLESVETEIKLLKEEDAKMKEKMGSPVIAVAVISFLGVCVTASASVAAVILAPAVRVWLGIN